MEVRNLDKGFFLATRNISQLRFQIVDGWGVVVLENNNEQENSLQAAECLRQGWNCQWKGWDGTFKGQQAPEVLYHVYIIYEQCYPSRERQRNKQLSERKQYGELYLIR